MSLAFFIYSSTSWAWAWHYRGTGTRLDPRVCGHSRGPLRRYRHEHSCNAIDYTSALQSQPSPRFSPRCWYRKRVEREECWTAISRSIFVLLLVIIAFSWMNSPKSTLCSQKASWQLLFVIYPSLSLSLSFSLFLKSLGCTFSFIVPKGRRK